jgi:hypothetical protein
MPTLPSVANGETRLLLQLNSRLSERPRYSSNARDVVQPAHRAGGMAAALDLSPSAHIAVVPQE